MHKTENQMKRAIIKYAGCAFLSGFAAVSIQAQSTVPTNTPAAYELMKLRSLWLQSPNAAGAFLDSPVNYAQVEGGYKTLWGDYHRSQDGSRINTLAFATEGTALVGKVFTWGKFSYDRDQIKDAGFNASLIDPYRGMPFYTVDSALLSNWNNQHYTMQFKVAVPLIANKLTIGIDGTYRASTGAKQRDPRTENDFLQFDLKPAVLWSVSDKHHIGANFRYYTIKEEASMGLNLSSNYVRYYNMYGLGNAIMKVGSGRSIDYNGDNVGGGLQYGFADDYLALVVRASYDYKVEDVTTGSSTPQRDGTVREDIREAGLMIYTKQGKLTHHLGLCYRDRNIDGIQYVNKYDNTATPPAYFTISKSIRSTYRTRTASADYAAVLNRDGGEYIARLDLGARVVDIADRYLMPVSTLDVNNLVFTGGLKGNFVLPGANMKRLLVGGDVTLQYNHSGGYTYGGTTPEYPIIEGIYEVDINYMAAEYVGLGGSVTYSQRISTRNDANIFVKADVNYINSSINEMNTRTMLRFSLGCNF